MEREYLKVLVHPETWGKAWHPAGNFELAVFSLSREAADLIELGKGWLRTKYRDNDIPNELVHLAEKGRAQIIRHSGKEYLVLRIKGGGVQAGILDPKKIRAKVPERQLLLLHCLPFEQRQHLSPEEIARLLEKIRLKKKGDEMV